MTLKVPSAHAQNYSNAQSKNIFRHSLLFFTCSYKEFEKMFLGQHLARESGFTVKSILHEGRQYTYESRASSKKANDTLATVFVCSPFYKMK
jgi:hypothetical protein